MKFKLFKIASLVINTYYKTHLNILLDLILNIFIYSFLFFS